MHKPPVLIMKSNNNSGHISELGERFAAEDPPINIRALGGAEWDGNGVFALAIDDDTPERLARVHAIAGELGFEHLELDGVAFELDDRPGSLGEATKWLAAEDPEINVNSLLVVGSNNDRPIVLIGVQGGDTIAANARSVLAAHDYVVYEHEVPKR